MFAARYKCMPHLAKTKNGKHDIILQEGDIVFVPEINPFVTVQGSVQSPLKIAFDKEYDRLMYYIDKAGGFGVKPWKRRVFVTYANGKSRRTKNFAFLHFYPKEKEGSTVIVPPKLKNDDTGDMVKSILIATIPVILTGFILNYLN